MPSYSDHQAPKALRTGLPAIPVPALVVLLGASGSGKTTFARRWWPAEAVVSLDALRAELTGDESNQDATEAAVELAHQRVQYGCAHRRTTVVDATNTETTHRAPLLAAAADHGLPAVAIVLATPLAVCLARQTARPGPLPGQRWGRRVPDDVVAAQHAAVATSVPTLTDEGFAAVYVIREEHHRRLATTS